jgi:glyoxylase-like metal-dependent hydrolase (beta-lactamase superfamily II)
MPETTPFSIHPLELGPLENFVYLIHDHATRRAAIVDPAWEVSEVLALAEQRGARITDILLTHSHHDHINGIQQVLETCPARIHLLKAEAEFWGHSLELPALHHGGDVILLGKTPIEILHTPGHTPGSACYRLGEYVVTGDTLFVFGCGRCDLRGGDPEQMFHTLKHLKNNLPPHTLLYPGHNYAEVPVSTMAEQVQGNPFLQFDDLPAFTYYRMHYHDLHRNAPYGPLGKESLTDLATR